MSNIGNEPEKNQESQIFWGKQHSGNPSEKEPKNRRLWGREPGKGYFEIRKIIFLEEKTQGSEPK